MKIVKNVKKFETAIINFIKKNENKIVHGDFVIDKIDFSDEQYIYANENKEVSRKCINICTAEYDGFNLLGHWNITIPVDNKGETSFGFGYFGNAGIDPSKLLNYLTAVTGGIYKVVYTGGNFDKYSPVK